MDGCGAYLVRCTCTWCGGGGAMWLLRSSAPPLLRVANEWTIAHPTLYHIKIFVDSCHVHYTYLPLHTSNH